MRGWAVGLLVGWTNEPNEIDVNDLMWFVRIGPLFVAIMLVLEEPAHA